MKIINPSFEIVYFEKDALQKIELMARISHRSEDKQTSNSWERFIKAVVVEHGDWSVVEHASATVIFKIDRALCTEMVRHRLFSFTQESTRFVRYGDRHQFEFIQPERIGEDMQSIDLFKVHCNNCESIYNTILARGGSPQEARSVLPNALAATIAVTGNLRNWRHFLLMRTSKETHPDFRRVTIPLLEKFKSLIPILYDDIEPNQRQIENMRKPR